jgi:arabinose-5-phosphate isomerase
MTGNPDSTLAKNSDYHLNIYVEEEACPLQLAPTSSTTTTLVMGDALAVALMKLRKFKDTDFARFHPGGSLGKKLLTTVEMVMQKDNLPVIDKKTISIDIVHAITNGRCGLCVVVDDKKNILGIITDGDLRRNMEKNKEKFFNITAEELMTKYPKSVNKNTGIVDAENLMISNGINALLVEETNQLVGIVQIYNI